MKSEPGGVAQTFTVGITGQLDRIEVWVRTLPEPSTLLLVSLGVVGLAARRRRSRAAS